MEKAPDIRYIRTEKQILDSFRQLILEQDLNKITVSMVAERSAINRKTFYLHFSDIEALINRFQEKMLSEIKDGLKSARAAKDEYSVVRDTFIYLSKSPELNYKLYTHSDYLRVLTEFMWMSNTEINISDFRTVKHPEIADAYLFNSIFSIFCAWYSAETRLDIHEMADYAAKIILDGLS